MKFGKKDNYKQAVATANKAPTGDVILNFITRKMEQNDIASVLAEIIFLSNTKRSSLVTIENETPVEILYHKCFIARGDQAHYVGFDKNVPPKSKVGYSFENHTRLSLDGCAAMLFFSVMTCESEECFFVVAFRNYVIKLRRPNKTVVVILKSFEAMDELYNLLQYSKIMNTGKNSKDVPGMSLEKKYQKPFMWAGCGQKSALEFPSIEICMDMMDTDDCHSQSTIRVLHPKKTDKQ